MDTVNIYLYMFTAIFTYIEFVLPISLSLSLLCSVCVCVRAFVSKSSYAVYFLKKQMRQMVNGPWWLHSSLTHPKKATLYTFYLHTFLHVVDVEKNRTTIELR